MTRENTVACSGCGKAIAPQEPRVAVKYQVDTYDSGGRNIARFCPACWPAARPNDQRHTREAAAR